MGEPPDETRVEPVTPDTSDDFRLVARVAPKGLVRKISANRPLPTAWADLQAILRSAKATELQALFARPDDQEEDGSRRWTTNLSGPVRRLVGLPPEERDAALSRLESRIEAAKRLSDQLATGNRDDRRASTLLYNALSRPGTGAVFVVGEEPVLVAWGHERTAISKTSPKADTKPTTGADGVERSQPTDPANPSSDQPPESVHQSIGDVPATSAEEPIQDAPFQHGAGRNRLLSAMGWAACLFLMLGLSFRLIAACPPGGDGCHAGDVSILAKTEHASERIELQGRLQLAEARLAGLECRPSTDVPVLTVATAPSLLPAPPAEVSATVVQPRSSEPPDEFRRRIEGMGGAVRPVMAALIWDGDADLNIALICPDGSRVDHQSPNVCGWRTALSANSTAPLFPEPVETLLGDGLESLPAGDYSIEVSVDLARSAQSAPVTYVVRADLSGRRLIGSGALREGDPPQTALSFSLPLNRQ